MPSAGERTRTSKGFHPTGPKPAASTSSATPARRLSLRGRPRGQRRAETFWTARYATAPNIPTQIRVTTTIKERVHALTEGWLQFGVGLVHPAPRTGDPEPLIGRPRTYR